MSECEFVRLIPRWRRLIVVGIVTTALLASLSIPFVKGEPQESNRAPAPPALVQLTWSPRAPLVIPRMDVGAAVVNNKIYVVGGFSGSTLSLVEEYDPATDVWTRKADMLSPRRLAVVAAVNDKVYAIGGVAYSDPNAVTYSFATEEYDPVANTWTPRASFPMDPPFNSVLGNVAYGGAAANGKIYVFVFNTNTPGTTATYEYDPASNLWDKTKAPVPFSYTGYSAASLNNKIYVLTNGLNGLGPISFAEYDPSTNIWITKPSPPTSRDFATLTATEDRVFAIGGLSRSAPFGALATVEAFDPQLSSWEASVPILTPRHSEGAAAVGGRVYVMGGAAGSYPYVPLSSVEAGDLGRKRDLYTLTPCRLVDTRVSPDGPLAGPALVAGASRSFRLSGNCGIPAAASAVSLNVTVTQASSAGDLRVYPTGQPLPLVSAINWSPGETRANSAIATLGSAGLSVQCDQASGTVHLIIDVNGYFR